MEPISTTMDPTDTRPPAMPDLRRRPEAHDELFALTGAADTSQPPEQSVSSPLAQEPLETDIFGIIPPTSGASAPTSLPPADRDLGPDAFSPAMARGTPAEHAPGLLRPKADADEAPGVRPICSLPSSRLHAQEPRTGHAQAVARPCTLPNPFVPPARLMHLPTSAQHPPPPERARLCSAGTTLWPDP